MVASGEVAPPVAERCLRGGGGFGRPRRAITILALTLLASGCYTYREVSPAAVPPGSSVRLRVDPRAQLSVGETPLPDGGRVIRGKLLPGGSADTMLCSVALSNGDPLTPLRGLRGTVSVAVADVDRLEVRRLQKGLTAAAVTTGALLGLVVLDWAFNITNPNEGPGDGGGGADNARIPLFRLTW